MVMPIWLLPLFCMLGENPDKYPNDSGYLFYSAVQEEDQASGMQYKNDLPVPTKPDHGSSLRFKTDKLSIATAPFIEPFQDYCLGGDEISGILHAGLSDSLSVIAADGVSEGLHNKWFGTLLDQKSEQNIDFFIKAAWLVESLVIFVLILFIFLHWRGHHRLKESEKRYRTLFENMTQGVFYQRSDGVVIACNPACLELFGLTYEQLIGKTLKELELEAIHEDGAPFSGEQYPSTRALKTGKPVHEIVAGVYNKRRKEYVWLSINATPQFKSGGQPHQVFVTLHDITDIKIAHKALDGERQHLQNILEGTRAGTWEWNVQTGETIFNNRWAEIIGYTLEEISPASIETWIHFSHPNDLEESNIQIQRHLSGEVDYYEFEVRMRHKSGDWVWVLDRGKVVSYSADGQPLWMAGTHSDITASKKAEEALRKTITINQAILKTIPDLIWLKDPNGVYLSCNSAFENFFSIQEGQIAGKKDDDFNAEPFVSFTDTKELGIDSRGVTSTKEEWVNMEDDAKQALMLTTKTHIFDHEGQLMGVLGIARDITEQFNTQAEIRQKESYQRALLDNFPFSVWLKDTQSRFLAVNQTYARFAGFSDINRLLGKTDFDIWPAELAETYRDDDCEVMDKRLKKKVIEEVTDHNDRKWFETYKAPVLGSNTELFGTVGFSYDITSLKQEEEIRILHLKKQRDELVREVNHRIKNHLQGLIGLLNHRKRHGEIYIDPINEVITQIKSIATVYGLQTELAGGEINLCRMLDAIVSSISGMSRVSLSASYEPGLTNYKVDQDKAVALSLVINELIMNAVKHTQQKKHDAKITIKCRRKTEYILLVIRNPGHLPKEFDFESNRGMGIGLELAKVMLPSQGAKLSISGVEDEVIVELILTHPLLDDIA